MHFARFRWWRVGHRTRPITTKTMSLARSACPARGDVRRWRVPIVFSSTTATYGVPDRVPITESDAAAPDQPLRLHEARYRARPGRLRPRLWSGLCGATVLQCLGVRADGRDLARITSPESHLIPLVLVKSRWASGARSRSLATIIPRPMAPASATTSTSTIWAGGTSRHSSAYGRDMGFCVTWGSVAAIASAK